MTFDLRSFSLMLAALFMAYAIPAHAQNKLGSKELNVPATLVSESQQVKAGQNVTLAFVMRPKPTWHGYWENPGDAGIGMSFDWSLPPGVTAGKASYPVPETMLISGIMNYVYEGEYAVLVNLVVSDKFKPGPLPISVKSEWLACTDEVCVPEQDELSISLEVVSNDAAVSLNSAFNGYRANLPRPLGSNGTFSVKNDIFRLSIPLPKSVAVDAPYFFIKEDGVVDYGAAQKVNRDGDLLIMETAARGDRAEPIVDAAVPLRIAFRQVVVDGDEMHVVTGKRVEVERQTGDEGLSLTRLHLGDVALVQNDAAHQLHVEEALARLPPASLTDCCEGLEEKILERLAVLDALLEFDGLGL